MLTPELAERIVDELEQAPSDSIDAHVCFATIACVVPVHFSQQRIRSFVLARADNAQQCAKALRQRHALPSIELLEYELRLVRKCALSVGFTSLR